MGLIALSALAIIIGPHAPYLVAKHYTNGITFYPASTAYVLGALGVSLLCLAALHRWVDQNENVKGSGPVLTFFRRYSQFALTVYIVHHMVHLWPLWFYGAWQGQDDPTYYWRQAMSTPAALALAVAFLALYYPA